MQNKAFVPEQNTLTITDAKEMPPNPQMETRLDSLSREVHPSPNAEDRVPRDRFFCDNCESWILKNEQTSHETSILHLFRQNKTCKAKPYYYIPPSNRGYQMLKRAGWREEEGLGKLNQGDLAPVKTRLKNDKKGIGRSQTTPLAVSHSTEEIRKAERKTKRSRRAVKNARRMKQTLDKTRENMLRNYLNQ
eukprot:TRINITY_DN288_c0_g1_i2.p1 TRINITY_DN288_c0_g1~~TRINITY_DN288_c0_g1_i2.p1  ORF type:complete len:213 (-),score=27.92 TRINITY_DN288_c0_g1_i2:48-620(-)